MTSLIVLGTAFCASIVVASISNYHRKTFEENCEEEYPILFEEEYSTNLSALTFKSIENKFSVLDEKQSVIFEIVKDTVKECSWFVKKNGLCSWEIQISRNNVNILGSKSKISYASSKQDCNGISSIKYCYSNLQYNAFSLFQPEKSSTDNSIKNDVEYRWLFASRYLEKIDFKHDKPPYKRIAFAINIGKNDNKNICYDYQSIYNHNEIDQECLIISLFLSIMTQWKHKNTYNEVLKQKLVEWNKIREIYYREQNLQKVSNSNNSQTSNDTIEDGLDLSILNKENSRIQSKQNECKIENDYNVAVDVVPKAPDLKEVRKKNPLKMIMDSDISTETCSFSNLLTTESKTSFFNVQINNMKRRKSIRKRLAEKTFNVLQKKSSY